jgi:hypothetical protein
MHEHGPGPRQVRSWAGGVHETATVEGALPEINFLEAVRAAAKDK